MSQTERSSLRPPSSEHRRIAAESYERASQARASGNFDYAIQLLLTCCKIDPGNLLYRQTLRRTQKAKFRHNLRGSRLAFLTTSRYRARLKVAKRARDYLRVLEYGEQILTRNPWDTGTQMDMAEAFMAVGQLDLAIFSLEQAREKNPKDVTVNRALARLLEKRGNFAAAIKLWQLVRQKVPDDVEAAHKAKDLAASETIQRGRYQQILTPSELSGSDTRDASEAHAAGLPAEQATPVDRVTREATPLLTKLESNPTDAQLYLQLASVYRRAGMADRARAVLQQGQGPTGHHFQLQLELMELEIEPFRRDLKHVEERLQRIRRDAEAELDEEMSRDELKRYRHQLLKEINARELEMYRIRAAREPVELQHQLELGIRLMRADLLDEAIVAFQQARKDHRLQGRASMFLGFCFKRRNNWRLAQRNFEEALSLLSAQEETQRKEVMYQLALGMAEQGELQQALDLGHELANVDFGFKDIGALIDTWETRLREAQQAG